MRLQRLSREAHRQAARWKAAAEAERQVAATLMSLTAVGWQLLVDRAWPGTRSANVDMILIGPPGVFVIDVKLWRDPPAVSGGRLHSGGEPRDGEVGKLLGLTRTVEEHAADLGMSPVALRPLMIFAGHRLDTRVGGVRLLGRMDAVPVLLGERELLKPAMVRAMAGHLADRFHEHDTTTLDEPATPATAAPPGP
ncbi:MAG: nuclease-related domain-containing protein, partial [Spirillospora sp.]